MREGLQSFFYGPAASWGARVGDAKLVVFVVVACLVQMGRSDKCPGYAPPTMGDQRGAPSFDRPVVEDQVGRGLPDELLDRPEVHARVHLLFSKKTRKKHVFIL